MAYMTCRPRNVMIQDLYSRWICHIEQSACSMSYNQIFSAWWVITILYSYAATLRELRYKYYVIANVFIQ